MKYGDKNIHICNLPFGQGFAPLRNHIYIKLVRYAHSNMVCIDETVKVIQHELKHTEQIIRCLIVPFYWIVILSQYATRGHSKAPYEVEARLAEQIINPALRIKVIQYCVDNNLLYS